MIPATLHELDYAYLTTTGRVSGKQHTIEIWFATTGTTIYMLAGNHRSDWVQNALHTPTVRIRIGEQTWRCTARPARDAAEDALARELVVGKYQPREEGSLENWGRNALPMAFEVDSEEAA